MSNQVIRQRSSGAGSGDDAPPSNGVHAIEMRSPSQEEEEENKKGKRPVRPQTRLERLVNCAETLFEYLTVGINLADVASDVFVAVQFYNNGDMVWFWLVVAFLALAHVVYTFTLYAVVKDLTHWQYVGWDNIPCFLRLVISFLLAQFAPVLNLIFQREHERHATNFDPTRMGCDEEDDGLGLDIDRGSISKAALEELKRIHDSRMLYVRMQKSFEQHMTKFGLFYVESGVEAAPQAIIQLLAITFLGRASWVQLVSLCCSLFSITSKAFVISRAYDLRVMIFKFACAAHDVFSTFYLFSTLVATETPKHASFFGLDVSWLGMLWLWKTLIVYVYSVISAIVVTFINIAESASHYDRVSLLKALGAGLFLSLPMLLFVEAAKTCWIVLYLAVTEPGTYMSPIFALVLSFVSHDDDKSSRLRYVFRRMEYPDAASQCCLPARAQLQCRRAADPTKPFTIWRIAAENVKEAIPNLRVVRTSFGAMKPRERLAVGWVVLSTALMFVAQLISLLYPFLNILFVAEQHNLLQTTCLYATLGAVTLLVCLTPRAALYAAVNAVFKESLPAVGSDVRTVTRWIEEYHRPTHIGVLQILVPVATLPQQVSGKVAQYLTPSDLGLQDLSVAECDALKQRLADTYGVEAAPDLQRQQSDVRPPDVMVPPSDDAAIIERVKELIDEQA